MKPRHKRMAAVAAGFVAVAGVMVIREQACAFPSSQRSTMLGMLPIAPFSEIL